MATHSTIAYRDPKTNKIKSIYCHSDGYISYNGEYLFKYYNTPTKVKKLIELGDIDELEPTIEETISCNTPTSVKVVDSLWQLEQNDFMYFFETKEKKWYVREFFNDEWELVKNRLK